MTALVHDVYKWHPCVIQSNAAIMFIATEVKVPAALVKARYLQHFPIELIKIAFTDLLNSRFPESGKDKIMSGKLLDSSFQNELLQENICFTTFQT